MEMNVQKRFEYRTSSGDIEKIGFYDYCKNVLPNEWVASWPEEALKAGAQ